MTKIVQEICTALEPTCHMLYLDKMHIMRPSAPTFYHEANMKGKLSYCFGNYMLIKTISCF
jgi:hypothetical protein